MIALEHSALLDLLGKLNNSVTTPRIHFSQRDAAATTEGYSLH
jgi:hypothetical protein